MFNDVPEIRLIKPEKSAAIAQAAALALLNTGLLPRVGNFQGLYVSSVPSVKHFKGMLVRSMYAEDGFYRNVLSSRGGATGFTFESDDFIVVFAFAFALEQGSLHITDPNAIECSLDVVVADQGSSGKRLAHHFTVKLLVQKPAIQYPVCLRCSLTYVGCGTGITPAFYLRFPLPH